MEIVLIRHGKPRSASNEKMNSAGFANWVRLYDHSELDPRSTPGHRLDLKDYFVVASSLKRAQLSAQLYTGTQPDLVMPEVREMDVPYYRSCMTLRAFTWVYLNRLYWLCGRAGRFESYKEGKLRVIKAADRLLDLVQHHKKLVVFGHGMTNIMLRAELKRRGWTITQSEGDYWGVSRAIY